MSQSTVKMIPFSEATEVEALDAATGTYRANIRENFLIGSGTRPLPSSNSRLTLPTVPNGGYVASCILRAASLHLAPASQPHPLTTHFEFLSRASPGPAIITIEVVKPGRKLTTLHATLHQHGLLSSAPWITPSTSRKCITAYLTMTNLTSASGLTLPTPLTLPHPPPPKPTPSLLATDSDPNWTIHPFMTSHMRNVASLKNLEYYAPRAHLLTTTPKATADIWIRFSTPLGTAKFTTTSLPFVVDCLPYPVEAFRPTKSEAESGAVPFAPDAVFWYPTVVMNLEVKRPLEGEGEKEWLYLRMQTKEIREGRFDLEVVVLDEGGELVAVAGCVNLVVGMERNMAGRRGKGKI